MVGGLLAVGGGGPKLADMRGAAAFLLFALLACPATISVRAQAVEEGGGAPGLESILEDLAGDAGEARSPAASREEFLSSVHRLVRSQDWSALAQLAGQAPSAVPRPLRDFLLGYAEIRSGRGESGELLLRKALAGSVATGRLAALTAFADQVGAKGETDAALLALCREPDCAGEALAAVRWRVKDPAKVVAAHSEAARVAPEAPGVRDFGRYVGLLEGEPVDREEIEAAVAAAPEDRLVRMTLLLARLRSEKPAAALSALDDILVVFNRMPPGAQAVISAAYAAAGEKERAVKMVSAINPAQLLPGEYSLVAPLRAEVMAQDFGMTGSRASLSGGEP